MRDYHRILDLPPDASPQEIKDRYRQLVRFFHPDRYPKDEDKVYAERKLKEINEAYEMLHGSSARGLRLAIDSRPPRPVAMPETVDFGVVVRGRQAHAQLKIDNTGGMAQSLNFHYRNDHDWFQIVKGESLHASDSLPMLLTLEASAGTLSTGQPYDSWLDIEMNGIRQRVTLTMHVAGASSPDRRLGWLLVAAVAALLIFVLMQARAWTGSESAMSAVSSPANSTAPLLAGSNRSAGIEPPASATVEPGVRSAVTDNTEHQKIEAAVVTSSAVGTEPTVGGPSKLIAISTSPDADLMDDSQDEAVAATPTTSVTETPTSSPVPSQTPTQTVTPQPSPTPSLTPTPRLSAMPTAAPSVEAMAVSAAPIVGSSITVTVPQTFQINARATTSIESTSLALLPKGATYPAIARTIDNAWTQIVLPDGRLAWVFTTSMVADMALIGTLPLSLDLPGVAPAPDPALESTAGSR